MQSDSSISHSPRIASIDAFRGLTILVMIFVNEVAGVKAVPWWMRHMEEDNPGPVDGMTFVDVVFPAFLFIVGMAIPFAIGGRLNKGATKFSVWGHILLRTLGLIIVGVFMVNMPADSQATGISSALWRLLVYVCVILVWNQYPKSPGTKQIFFVLLRVAGACGLVYLAMIYRGKANGEIVRMRTQWWGILGLIGWAYLVATAVYMVFRNQLAAIMGMMTLGIVVYMGDHAGAFKPLAPISEYLNIGEIIGSQPSIVLSGMILGLLLLPCSPAPTHASRIKWMLTFAIGLACAGFWLRPIYGISKNNATPPWCLLCSAICCVLFAGIYWIMDVRGWKRWTTPFRPAAENSLLVYILPGMFLSLMHYWPKNPLVGKSPGLPGILHCAVFAVAMLGVAWVLGKIGIRLRL